MENKSLIVTSNENKNMYVISLRKKQMKILIRGSETEQVDGASKTATIEHTSHLTIEGK